MSAEGDIRDGDGKRVTLSITGRTDSRQRRRRLSARNRNTSGYAQRGSRLAGSDRQVRIRDVEENVVGGLDFNSPLGGSDVCRVWNRYRGATVVRHGADKHDREGVSAVSRI